MFNSGAFLHDKYLKFLRKYIVKNWHLKWYCLNGGDKQRLVPLNVKRLCWSKINGSEFTSSVYDTSNIVLWCSPSVLSTKRSSYIQYLCKSHFGRLFVQSHFPNNYYTKDSLVSMDKYRVKLVLSGLEREGIPGKLLLFISTNNIFYFWWRLHCSSL